MKLCRRTDSIWTNNIDFGRFSHSIEFPFQSLDSSHSNTFLFISSEFSVGHRLHNADYNKYSFNDSIPNLRKKKSFFIIAMYIQHRSSFVWTNMNEWMSGIVIFIKCWETMREKKKKLWRILPYTFYAVVLTQCHWFDVWIASEKRIKINTFRPYIE